MENKKPKVAFVINGKDIVLELDPVTAPKTVANFLKLVKEGFYNGLCFHRVIAGFMMQGGGFRLENGAPKEAKKVDTVVGEFAQNGILNHIKHTKGVISMARTMVNNSASGQFFICTADVPHLDGAYAAFGKTADEKSLENVLALGREKTRSLGGQFTDFPTTPIIIESAKEI